MRKLLNITLFFFSIIPLTSAQVTKEWVQRYDGPDSSFDIADQMILKADGSILVFGNTVGTGTSADITIIKYSNGGSEEWVSRYNGPGNSTDNVRAAAIDPQGNIYLTGFVNDSSFASRCATLKFDPNGNFQWIRLFDSVSYSVSFGESIVIGQDGSLYTGASARNSLSGFDFVLIKYSSSGEKLWQKAYNGLGNSDDNIISIARDSGDNIYATGSSKGSDGSQDFVTIKYSPSGTEEFVRTFTGASGGDDRPTSMVVDNMNNIIVTGVLSTDSNSFDYATLKYSSSGDVQWIRTYNGTGSHLDYPYQVITDNLNNVYVTGSSRNADTLGSEDVLTVKYNPAGDTLWVNRFDGQAGGSDIGYCISTDSDYNVYIGSATDRGGLSLIFGTIKINPQGGFLWLQTYEYWHSPEDFPYNIAVDSEKNIYLCGISFGGGATDYDIATIKYSQTVNISSVSGSLPDNFTLTQNYPNPFNPSTNIKFSIRESGLTIVKIHNTLGQLVNTPVNTILSPGEYEVRFDAAGLPSGVYFYSLYSGLELVSTKSMMLLK